MTPAKQNEYMQKVSSLLYATIITYPDTAKAANKLSEFSTNPSLEHLNTVNHTIVYLYHTYNYTLEYSAPSANLEEVFICASDTVYGNLIG